MVSFQYAKQQVIKSSANEGERLRLKDWNRIEIPEEKLAQKVMETLNIIRKEIK